MLPPHPSCVPSSSPQRKECLFLLRLNSGPWGRLLCIGFLCLHPLQMFSFLVFVKKKKKSHITPIHKTMKNTTFKKKLDPTLCISCKAVLFLATSPHMQCCLQSAFAAALHLLFWMFYLIAGSLSKSRFLATVPQPVLLSLCCFHHCSFLTSALKLALCGFYNLTLSPSSYLAVWRLFFANLPFWKSKCSTVC